MRGGFSSFSGAITVADADASFVAAEIAIDSIRTGIRLRDAIIKREPIFDTARYPTASFVSTGVTTVSDRFLLEGDLTLKGVTRPICLDLTFAGTVRHPGIGDLARFAASVVLRRRDFDIALGLPGETGGVLLGEEISVDIAIGAVRKP